MWRTRRQRLGLSAGLDKHQQVMTRSPRIMLEVCLAGLVSIATTIGLDEYVAEKIAIAPALSEPRSVAVSGTTLFVANSNSHCVRAFPLSSSGAALGHQTEIGKCGKAGVLDRPVYLTVSDNLLFIIDDSLALSIVEVNDGRYGTVCFSSHLATFG